jgi:hypothetical protein
MAYTPEFQVTIVPVSSPLTLLLALWGMTSKLTLHTMESSKLAMASTLQNTVEMTGGWRHCARFGSVAVVLSLLRMHASHLQMPVAVHAAFRN